MLERDPQLALRHPGAGSVVPVKPKHTTPTHRERTSAPEQTFAPERTFGHDLAELNAVRQQCRALVTRSAGLSGVAAVVPIPAADIGVDITLFLKLLPEINRRFGLAPQQIAQLDSRTKELILVSITSIGSQAIGRVVTAELVMQLLRRIGIRVTLKSAAKWVPIIGQAAAASISFGAMRLVGNRHVEECYRVALAVLEARRPAVEAHVVAPSGAAA